MAIFIEKKNNKIKNTLNISRPKFTIREIYEGYE